MAVRIPTPPQAKSTAMAEMLQASSGEVSFKSGSIVDGSVTAIKGDDIFVDIGYKSAGSVSASEFGEDADVKIGDKVSVMIVKLEDDKTGMIELSKRIKVIVDDKARYTDWSTRDDIKANLQVDLILLLDEFDYPPVTIDDVYKEVLEQAENFKKYAK